ncbi:alpha/beta fold hydrolase [Demequina sp. NBRC 110057]|uniref:alpha/beta fold hydrolase n=1 Tax=Demequina sp. NBRC 110057 TaxID=1570346 RepID=UPI000A069F3B|nr:alpha/beta fold hydrolase [Demequina sp. NBRC 110057]
MLARVEGPVHGIPVVLLHGFAVDHRILTSLEPVFDSAGAWRRHYLDLPGHGTTPGDGVASARDVADAVVAWVEDTLGDAPFAIVGNSFGGQIAREVAHRLRARVLGLALIVPVIEPVHERRDRPARTALREDPGVVATITVEAEGYADMAVDPTPADAAAFVAHVAPGLGAADGATLDRIGRDYAIDPSPEEASSEQFAAPALILTGRQDHSVGYRDAWALLDHYPRATFAALDAAGHHAHLERDALARALVTDWLERVARELAFAPPAPTPPTG